MAATTKQGNTAAKNGKGGSKREAALKRDLALAPKVLKARKAGKSWAEIKDELGVDQPKGQVLIKIAALKPEDRIKHTTEGQLQKAVVKERKAGTSWADIAVRAGVTIGAVKAAYEAATGESAAESRVKAPAKTPAAKKTAAKSVANGARKVAKGKAAPVKTKTRKRGQAQDPSQKD
jgi:hypothetical protein